ncbi:MAG: hypothetical protein Q7R32_13440 [Dehalococcoidia bacterium]|nr:hypothetical protein [Dehalococcoidia bacterium]
MPDVQPGREEELRRLRRWLAFSERLDKLIEASETRPAFRPAPVLANTPARHAHGLRARPFGRLRAGPFDKLRAGFAAGLTRMALALHREAATGAVLRPEAKTVR